MKKRYGPVLMALITVCIMSCAGKDSADKKTPGNDPIIPPPDQTDASTNPSSADTLFSKDTSYRKIDSVRKK